MNIPAFPKIFALGTDYIKDIFDGEVEVTEKIDGSQFAFGRVGGVLCMRSKGAMLYPEQHPKMFAKAVAHVLSIQHALPDNLVFYCETLDRPKHNTLTYERVPHNNLMLFGMMTISQSLYPHSVLRAWGNSLDIEVAPLLYIGNVVDPQDLTALLGQTSVLGGPKIEGMVVKNYAKQFLLGGQPIPLMMGKLVSEAFKEVHRGRWGKEETGKGKLETFYESFRSPARWEKAVNHLAERGELLNSPADIGKLIRETHLDIEAEEREAIAEWLWKVYSQDLKRRATAGLAEWYKAKLLERGFE